MRVISYPERYEQTTLNQDIICFMAGGMGNTEWHERFLKTLEDLRANMVIINPYNPNVESTFSQVAWEFYHLNNFLNKNFIFSIYFDQYTNQPVSMYELGRMLAKADPCFIKVETAAQQVSVVQNYGFPCVISMHENTPLKEDIKCQCGLVHQQAIMRTPEEHAHAVWRAYKDIKNQLV